MVEKPDIFDYEDFRLYLADFYSYKKAQGVGFSYRLFAKKCGFSSPNFLKLVIDAKRNLSPDSTEKFLTILEFDNDRAEYFRRLVEFCQSKDDEQRALSLQAMQKLKPYSNQRQVDEDHFQYMSHWLNPVIREMALKNDFKDDPYWISRKLTGRASIGEIRESLDFLKKAKFIEKMADGSFRCQEKIVISSDEVKNLALRQYYRAALDQGKDFLSDLAVEEREFGSLILALPEKSLGEFKQRLKAFRREMHQWALDELSGDEESSQVIQFNFQMFPQTRGKKSGS